MIISASRRTDIPAFYAKWFMNRVREGYCVVPNPFYPNQVSRISLQPSEVDVIVFWTRNLAPLIPYLNELDSLGLRYYFQYTILKNPKELDQSGPGFEGALTTFQRLSQRIGAGRVIWRYDPMVFTPKTGMSVIGSWRKSVKRLGSPWSGCRSRENIIRKKSPIDWSLF